MQTQNCLILKTAITLLPHAIVQSGNHDACHSFNVMFNEHITVSVAESYYLSGSLLHYFGQKFTASSLEIHPPSFSRLHLKAI